MGGGTEEGGGGLVAWRVTEVGVALQHCHTDCEGGRCAEEKDNVWAYIRHVDGTVF